MSRRGARLPMGGVAVFYAAMGLIAVAIAHATHHAPIPVAGSPALAAAGIALGLGLGLGVVGLSRAVTRTAWGDAMERELGAIVGAPTRGEAALMAGASAVGEELLFRGVALPALGLIPSALLFGALHIGRSRALLPWTAFAALLGLVLGGLTLITGGVLGAVVAHATINYLNLLAMARGQQ